MLGSLSSEYQNTVSIDLEMPAKPYQMARNETLPTALALMHGAKPSVIAEEYHHIPTMPPDPTAPPHSICATANQINARLAEHRDEPEPELVIQFKGKRATTLFTSLREQRDAGRNTYFDVNYTDRHGKTESGLEACDNLCLALDEAIPTTEGSFAELCDPRQELPFTDIARSVGRLLMPSAKTIVLEQSYHAKDWSLREVAFDPANGGPDFYEMQFGARLLLRHALSEGSDVEAQTVRLSVLAPFETRHGTILKQLQYNFDPNNPQQKPNARLVLMSHDVDIPHLKSQARKDWRTSGDIKPVKAALELLQDEYLDNFNSTFPAG